MTAAKHIFYGLVICVTFFALAELTLWTFGATTLIEREDPAKGFSGLVDVFVPDGDVHRTRQYQRARTFNKQSFLTDKPANGLRIFCLGGSSSFGFPWGADVAFTAILGDVLQKTYPERFVEAVKDQ